MTDQRNHICTRHAPQFSSSQIECIGQNVIKVTIFSLPSFLSLMSNNRVFIKSQNRNDDKHLQRKLNNYSPQWHCQARQTVTHCEKALTKTNSKGPSLVRHELACFGCNNRKKSAEMTSNCNRMQLTDRRRWTGSNKIENENYMRWGWCSCGMSLEMDGKATSRDIVAFTSN